MNKFIIHIRKNKYIYFILFLAILNIISVIGINISKENSLLFSISSGLIPIFFAVIQFFENQKIENKNQEKENKKLLGIFRSYEEIRRKFDVLMFQLAKIYFVNLSKEDLNYLQTELNIISKDFFKNAFVTENENIYTLWKERENKVLIYLRQYSMRDGLVGEENGIEYTISHEWRKNKLRELEKYILDSDYLLHINEEKILK